MSDLKPCPFCGCEVIMSGPDGRNSCFGCGAICFSHRGANWNTRPIEDALFQQVVVLQAALGFTNQADRVNAQMSGRMVHDPAPLTMQDFNHGQPPVDALRKRVKGLEEELLMLAQAYRRGMDLIRAVLPDCGPDPFWEAGEKLKAIATPGTTPITDED